MQTRSTVRSDRIIQRVRKTLVRNALTHKERSYHKPSESAARNQQGHAKREAVSDPSNSPPSSLPITHLPIFPPFLSKEEP